MAEDFHIDMSGRIYKRKTIGIACVGANSRSHNGCALKGNVIKYIQKNLCLGSKKKEYAKLYAICIYFLIEDKKDKIGSLIICNDEEFLYVKKYLIILLGHNPSFHITSITDLRKKLGKKVGSLADNFAEGYRKRALHRKKWGQGKKLNVVNITYSLMREKWDLLKEK